MLDLRSDTVTQPTEAMRAAMAAAEVGDDVYREDPTVRRLEERTAAIVGTEAALFVPSGTMANQIALLGHCRPGEEVLVGWGSHCAEYESGAAAAWSGVQLVPIGEGGLYTAADVEAAIKPPAYYQPRTRLVVVENTHNAAGGRLFPHEQVQEVVEVARRLGLGSHLDGARLWNAAVASGRPERELAAGFDTVTVCFSKGLGAPVGSAFCGGADAVEAGLRHRKMLGGGMRQAGIIAAGALYALEHQRARLEEDHGAARALGDALAAVPGATVAPVETNIVMVDLPVPAERVMACAERRGVLVGATGARRIRAVTHRDVVEGGRFDKAIGELVAALREACRG